MSDEHVLILKNPAKNGVEVNGVFAIDTSKPGDKLVSFDEFAKWLNTVIPTYVT